MTSYNSEEKRSVAKAITYRLMIIISDMVVVFTITRRLDLTVGLVIFTNIASTILYFTHERIWNKIQWGREDRNK